MTTIRQLEIRGIRSFGCSENEEQHITFRSPLTIIVGENGCGKTTIIECLKYAITGEYPPNTGTGSQFLQDFKIAGSDCVNGQVKLQVEDSKGNRTTIVRSLKKEKKRDTEKFSTADTTISYLKKGDSQAVHRNSRGGDANTEMCDAMGVSKAILNSVIFCHQEESCWPFSTAKELKVKFDAIFGTTEYIKVVEKLVKERKERQVELKILVEKEKSALALKDEVQLKRDRQASYELNFSKLKEESERLGEKIKPMQERIERIAETEMKFSQLYKKKVETETALKHLEDRQQTSRGKIRTLFQGDRLELERAIRDFENRQEQAHEARISAERELQSLVSQKASLEDRIKHIELQSEKVKNEIEQEQETCANRAQLAKDLGTVLGAVMDSELELENDNRQAEVFIGQLEGMVRTEEEKLAQEQQRCETEDQKLQAEIDRKREEKTKTETEVQGKRQSRVTLSKERGELQRAISNIETNQAQLTEMIAEISNLDVKISQMIEQAKIEQARENLKKSKGDRDTLQLEDDTLNEQIMELSNAAQIISEINFKEQDLKKGESTFKMTLNRHSSTIQRLLGRAIEANFKSEIDRKMRALDEEVKESTNLVKKHENRLVELRTTRKSLRDRLAEKEADLKKHEDEIYDKCGDDDFTELLEKRKEKYMKAQMEFGAVKSSEALFKKYISEVREQPCCPLCHKDMDSTERNMLSDELTEKISQLPHQLKASEKALRVEERAYNQLLGLKSVHEQVEKLKTKDIPFLQDESKKREEEMKKIQTELEDLEVGLAGPAEDLRVAQGLVSDMSQLDTCKATIDKLGNEVSSLRAKLPPNVDSGDLEKFRSRRQEVQQQLRAIREVIEKTEEAIERDTSRLNRIQEARNKLMDDKMKMQDSLMSLPDKKARLAQLVADVDTIDKDIAELQTRSTRISRELEVVVDKKQSVKEANRRKLQEMQERVRRMLDLQKEIQRDSQKIRAFAERKLQEQLGRMREQYGQKSRELEQNSTKTEATAQRLDELKSEIANQESAKRDLVENLDLKRIEEEVGAKRREMERLEVDSCSLDMGQMNREKMKLTEARDKLQAERSQIAGKVHQIESQIAEVAAELEVPRNKSAFEDWTKKMHMKMVLELVVDDLENYRTALEYSLTKYHQEKMSQINQTIRALWREIYRGNDIDYIEIRAQEPKERGTSKIRKYDYRVVQCKNNNEIDMRGSCSAGQKILASLIIRMALSETFSANCGVMTLDEPTTNLDQQNIASLCEAIAKILDDRGKYGNIMLVIITHDEKFLQTLAPYLASAYRVFRNRDGKSVIEKV